jgi:hypothetical protein
MDAPGHALLTALGRARAPILWIGSTYLLSAAVGAGMVHAHNGFALRYRDNMVGNAQKTAVGKAMNHGMPLRAALGDFMGNLFLGAVPSTVMGLSVVMPFPWVAFRGWVGGIVSVDGEHISRLRDNGERVYYLGILLLQLIPYTLAGGTGVRLGLAFLFPKGRWGYPPPSAGWGFPQMAFAMLVESIFWWCRCSFLLRWSSSWLGDHQTTQSRTEKLPDFLNSMRVIVLTEVAPKRG